MPFSIRSATAFLLLISPLAGAIAQDDGVSSLPVFTGPFPDVHNMRFLAQVGPDDLGALPVPGVWAKGMMNDIWGWTSPNGEEYALIPNSGGIAIVRVTDPANPAFLGRIESQNPLDFGNIWGGAATFGNYAYFVTEIVGSSLVIVDLSVLDSLGPVDDPFTDLAAPVFYFNGGGYESSHNVWVNEASGFAYLAGVRLTPGAANNACGADQPARFNTMILDLNADPVNPAVAACIANAGESDFFVVNYTGPDPDYGGREIAFVFDGRDREGQAMNPPMPIGGKTLIWDVTDKANIIEIASFRTPGMVYSDNGWTTTEQDFLFISDEIDELVQAGWAFSFVFAQVPTETTNKPRTGTYIVDIRDLDNPVFAQRFEDEAVGLDKHLLVREDKLYLASYTSGARVMQIGRDSNGDVFLEEVASMDTEPRLPGKILNINQEERFGSSFLGQWGIYALFPSDTIIASDINNGLIVMRLSDEPCARGRCNK
jgi:choice-of-anchor B domain-containing protein